MKKLFKQIFAAGDYPALVSTALLFVRLLAGVFMLTHGFGKFMMLFGEGPVQFADPIGMGVTASLYLTVFAEFFCSILLIVGFGTRLSALPLLITMLVAALLVHGGDPFMRKELPLLYAGLYAVMILTGAGRFSVDYLISARLKKNK